MDRQGQAHPGNLHPVHRQDQYQMTAAQWGQRADFSYRYQQWGNHGLAKPFGINCINGPGNAAPVYPTFTGTGQNHYVGHGQPYSWLSYQAQTRASFVHSRPYPSPINAQQTDLRAGHNTEVQERSSLWPTQHQGIEPTRQEGIELHQGIDPTRQQGIDPTRQQGIDPTRQQGIDPTRQQGIDPTRRQGTELHQGIGHTRQQDIESTRQQGIDPTRQQGIDLTQQQGIEPTRQQGIEPTRQQGIDPTWQQGIEPTRQQGTELHQGIGHMRQQGIEPTRQQGIKLHQGIQLTRQLGQQGIEPTGQQGIEPTRQRSIGPTSQHKMPQPGNSQDTSPRKKQCRQSVDDCHSSTYVKQSRFGSFGWTAISDVSVPYIMRGSQKYLSVRVVELKLLSKFPNSYPEEVNEKGPLNSEFASATEAALLNEINSERCAYEYGRQPFTQKDLIVTLQDFIDFYGVVKKHFSRKVSKQTSSPGGWLQVNNTVVPYVSRGPNDEKFVPLSVIRYAAGLLSDTRVCGTEPTAEECTLLNNMCKDVGVDFTFNKSTKFVSVQVFDFLDGVSVKELPKNDPFGHAQYQYHQSHSGPPSPARDQCPTDKEQSCPSDPAHMPPSNTGPQSPGTLPSPGSSLGGHESPAHAITKNTNLCSPPREPRDPSAHSVQVVAPPIPFNHPVGKPPGQTLLTREQFLCLAKMAPITIDNRVVSGINKGGAMYSLVETLARIFFPSSSLADFSNVLENVLKVPVKRTTADEEAAFIYLYCLPVQRLNCNKITMTEDFRMVLPQLRYILDGKTLDLTEETSSSKRASSNKRASPPVIVIDDSPVKPPAKSTSVYSRTTVSNSSSCLQQLKDFVSRKRAAEYADEPNKTRRLEDTVTQIKEADHLDTNANSMPGCSKPTAEAATERSTSDMLIHDSRSADEQDRSETPMAAPTNKPNNTVCVERAPDGNPLITLDDD